MSQTTETAPSGAPETLGFQAEVKDLLSLVVHSLYKTREVFLRELISNASDAIDKRRHEALTRPELGFGEAEGGSIELVPDPAARTLTVSDDGIGMNREDLVSSLGTIARSGTKAFLQRLAETGSNQPELIGQFGVGFYSSFIVADKVVVETRKAGEAQGWRWTSDGKSGYVVEPIERAKVGTDVVLHLRQLQGGEDEDDPADFLREFELRDTVRRWSDFVAHPIRMEIEQREDGDDDKEVVKRQWVVLNSRRPLWSRSKEEIKKEEYDEFYRRLAHDWTPPFETIHFKAEGGLEYSALLFVPERRPMDLFDGTQGRSRIALYVRRVLIMQESEDLLPSWLRFVRGVVDSNDLPLNVSREVLQSDSKVRAIGKRLVKRVLDALDGVKSNDRERYARFWRNFGVCLKEGIWFGADDEGRIAKLCLWESTRGEAGKDADLVSLDEYVARMQPNQEHIWYLSGNDRLALSGSPHLEGPKKRGEEVLFLVDPIDEWVAQRLTEWSGKKLVALDRSADGQDEAGKEAREALEREHREALTSMEERLARNVKAVRFTTRLEESPAVLVSDANAVSPHMQRILRASNQEVAQEKRILELNAAHPLVQRLLASAKDANEKERVGELTEVLHGQAVLAEGGVLEDPGRFAKLLARLLS
ncbi:MAG: hypothetical protein RL112_907 [Planctomycetota bacterium]